MFFIYFHDTISMLMMKKVADLALSSFSLGTSKTKLANFMLIRKRENSSAIKGFLNWLTICCSPRYINFKNKGNYACSCNSTLSCACDCRLPDTLDKKSFKSGHNKSTFHLIALFNIRFLREFFLALLLYCLLSKPVHGFREYSRGKENVSDEVLKEQSQVLPPAQNSTPTMSTLPQ